MTSIDEFVQRALRNIKLRRTQLLRNITVREGVTDPTNGGASGPPGSTIPYSREELELLRSIESDLLDLLRIFDRRAEEIASQRRAQGGPLEPE